MRHVALVVVVVGSLIVAAGSPAQTQSPILASAESAAAGMAAAQLGGALSSAATGSESLGFAVLLLLGNSTGAPPAEGRTRRWSTATASDSPFLLEAGSLRPALHSLLARELRRRPVESPRDFR